MGKRKELRDSYKVELTGRMANYTWQEERAAGFCLENKLYVLHEVNILGARWMEIHFLSGGKLYPSLKHQSCFWLGLALLNNYINNTSSLPSRRMSNNSNNILLIITAHYC